MKTTKRVTLAASALATAFLMQGYFAAVHAAAAENSPISREYRERGKEDVAFQKVPAVKMFDNLWYVGPGYVSAYLIKTSAGAILIDTSEEPDMVTHVIDSIQKTGTQMKDIKAIIISHGHIDHWGGVERVRELSGAPVYAAEEDWKMIEEVAAKPDKNGKLPRAPKRDKVVHDGDTLTVGDTTLKLYITPGHTPGVISTEFTVYDNGKPHQALFSGGTGGRGGVKGFEEALVSLARLQKMSDVEVFLPNHGWNPGGGGYPNGSLFERFKTLAARKAGEPNPFIDQASWREFLVDNTKRVQNQLEDAKKKEASAK